MTLACDRLGGLVSALLIGERPQRRRRLPGCGPLSIGSRTGLSVRRGLAQRDDRPRRGVGDLAAQSVVLGGESGDDGGCRVDVVLQLVASGAAGGQVLPQAVEGFVASPAAVPAGLAPT